MLHTVKRHGGQRIDEMRGHDVAGQGLDDRRQIIAIVVFGNDLVAADIDGRACGRQIDLYAVMTVS